MRAQNFLSVCTLSSVGFVVVAFTKALSVYHLYLSVLRPCGKYLKGLLYNARVSRLLSSRFACGSRYKGHCCEEQYAYIEQPTFVMQGRQAQPEKFDVQNLQCCKSWEALRRFNLFFGCAYVLVGRQLRALQMLNVRRELLMIYVGVETSSYFLGRREALSPKDIKRPAAAKSKQHRRLN